MAYALATSRSCAHAATLVAEGTAALSAAGVGTPRLDAELLLAIALGIDRTALYGRADDPLSDRAVAAFRTLLARRARREPLQYIVGTQEFWSLDFAVTPAVLVPRPETELLVELVAAAALGGGAGRDAGSCALRAGGTWQVCDVGTGSGCIAVALARELPDAQVWALDVAPAALALAAVNAQRHGVAERVRCVRSDLLASVSGQRFDVIVSNPPYLTANDLAALQPEVAWEPRAALAGGEDGLDIIRRLLAQVPQYLVEGGRLFMEIGATQADAVEQLARGSGLTGVSTRYDHAGLPRVLVARR